MGNVYSQKQNDTNAILGGDDKIINNVKDLKNLENKLIEFLNTTGFISNGIQDFSNYIKQLNTETDPNIKNFNSEGTQDAINGIKDYLTDGLNMTDVKHYNNEETLSAGYKLLSNISNNVLHFLDEDKAMLNYNINNLNNIHNSLHNGLNSLSEKNLNKNVLNLLNKTSNLIDEQSNYLSLINESEELNNIKNNLHNTKNISNDSLDSTGYNILNYMNNIVKLTSNINDYRNVRKLYDDNNLFLNSDVIQKTKSLNEIGDNPSYDNMSNYIEHLYNLIDENKNNIKTGSSQNNNITSLQNRLFLNKNWDSVDTVKNILSNNNYSGGFEQLSLKPLEFNKNDTKSQTLNYDGGETLSNKLRNSLRRNISDRNSVIIANSVKLSELLNDISSDMISIIPALKKLNNVQLSDLEIIFKKFLVFNNFKYKHMYLILLGFFVDIQSDFIKKDFMFKLNNLKNLSNTGSKILPQLNIISTKISQIVEYINSTTNNFNKQYSLVRSNISELKNESVLQQQYSEENRQTSNTNRTPYYDVYNETIYLDLEDIPDLTIVNTVITNSIFKLLYAIRLNIYNHKLTNSNINHDKNYEELVGKSIGGEIDKIKLDYTAIMNALNNIEKNGQVGEFLHDKSIELNYPISIIPIPIVSNNANVNSAINYEYVEIKKIFMYLPTTPNVNEINNNSRDHRAWGRLYNTWLDDELNDGVNLQNNPISGQNLRQMISNYKEFFINYYESIIGLHNAAQAIDIYLMKFTQKLKKTPELVEKLDALLSSSKLSSILHTSTSVNKLISVFDPNNYNEYVEPSQNVKNNIIEGTDDNSIKACGAGACDTVRPIVDLIANRKPDNSLNRGGVTDDKISDRKQLHEFGSTYFEKYRIDENEARSPIIKLKQLKEFYKHNSTLSNILSLFFSLLSIDDIKNSSLSPKTILDYLVNFMSWGSYMITHVPSTTDIKIGFNNYDLNQLKNRENSHNFIGLRKIYNDNGNGHNPLYVGSNDSLSVFNTDYSAMNIFDTNVRVGLVHSNYLIDQPKSKYINSLQYKSQVLYSTIIKAITGKILTVLGMYDIQDYKNNKPWRTFILDTTRLTIGGGSYSDVKINDTIPEFYIRIPLLLKFYKTIFYDITQEDQNIKQKFANLDKEHVKILPEFDYPFDSLIKHYFMFYNSQNNDNMASNILFNKELFYNINKIYDHFSTKSNVSKSNLLNYVVDQLVQEINNKYGLLFNSDLNLYKSRIAKTMGLDIELMNSVNYDIQHNNLYGPESILQNGQDNSSTLPSQKYTKVKDPYKSGQHNSLPNFSARQFYDNIYDFRSFIQSILTKSINNKQFSEKYNIYSSFFDIDEYINDIKSEFSNNQSLSDDDKIMFLASAANAKNQNIQNVDANKKQLIYDFIITPLKQVSNLLDFLGHVRTAFSNECFTNDKHSINMSSIHSLSNKFGLLSNSSLLYHPISKDIINLKESCLFGFLNNNDDNVKKLYDDYVPFNDMLISHPLSHEYNYLFPFASNYEQTFTPNSADSADSADSEQKNPKDTQTNTINRFDSTQKYLDFPYSEKGNNNRYDNMLNSKFYNHTKYYDQYETTFNSYLFIDSQYANDYKDDNESNFLSKRTPNVGYDLDFGISGESARRTTHGILLGDNGIYNKNSIRNFPLFKKETCVSNFVLMANWCPEDLAPNRLGIHDYPEIKQGKLQDRAYNSTYSAIEYLVSKLLKNIDLFDVNVSPPVTSSYSTSSSISFSFGKIDNLIEKQINNVNKILNEFKNYTSHDNIFPCDVFLRKVTSQYKLLFKQNTYISNENNTDTNTTIYDIQNLLNKFLSSDLTDVDIKNNVKGKQNNFNFGDLVLDPCNNTDSKLVKMNIYNIKDLMEN